MEMEGKSTKGELTNEIGPSSETLPPIVIPSVKFVPQDFDSLEKLFPNGFNADLVNVDVDADAEAVRTSEDNIIKEVYDEYIVPERNLNLTASDNANTGYANDFRGGYKGRRRFVHNLSNELRDEDESVYRNRYNHHNNHGRGRRGRYPPIPNYFSNRRKSERGGYGGYGSSHWRGHACGYGSRYGDGGHGRVQSVKLLSEDSSPSSASSRNGGSKVNACLSYVDIRSASKALRSTHNLLGNSLNLNYHDPGGSGSVHSRGTPIPPSAADTLSNSSPCPADDPTTGTGTPVRDSSENGSNSNPLPGALSQGSSPVVGVSNGPGSGSGQPYRQRFLPQHGQSEDSSSHFYEQPKGFSRGRGDGRGFHGGGRGRREHRHYNNRHSSFPVEGRNNYRSWGYANEGRFAPPAHSEPDERTAAPPSTPHPAPSETGSKGPRRPDSPASSVSSRHMPSKNHKSSRSVSESGSSDPGSSPGSRSGSPSSVSTSMSSGRSRSPPHHGTSGHYSRGSSSGGRFQQNSYSRQRYSRSRLVSRPADSSRARHSSRSSPTGVHASPSSSTSSSPSPHRKIQTTANNNNNNNNNTHSRSHSPSSVKSYSPSRSLNTSAGHNRHHHSNNRKLPTALEAISSIRIRNLPTRSSDSSLKDGLYHEYKKHGKVSWVRIMGSGSERFAVVCFKSQDHSLRAVAHSQEKHFFGSKIQVTPYNPPGTGRGDESLHGTDDENRVLGEDEPSSMGFPTRTLLITGLDSTVTSEELQQELNQFGDIVQIDIRKTGGGTQAICEFVDISSALRVQWGRHVFKSREAKISFYRNPPTSSLLLDGTSGVSEKQIASQCSPYGVIKSITMSSDKSQALVQYEEISSAQTALKELRGWAIKGNHLYVDSASPGCIKTFISRISNGLSESSLSLSPSLRAGSVSPPLSGNPGMTKDAGTTIRRLHHKNMNSNGDRRILYRPNEFDPETVKQNAQSRIYKENAVEIGVNSHSRVNEENQFGSGVGGGARHRRHEYANPVSPVMDNVIVNGDRGRGRSELQGKTISSKIDLSCHETDSAIVTSSSDVITIEKSSPGETSRHLAFHNHRGSNFQEFNHCDPRQPNSFESTHNMINRKLSTWSKAQNTLAAIDGVSSTSPEPKTETVRKASPDPGIGVVEFESASTNQPEVVTTNPRDSLVPRRSSADSGNDVDRGEPRVPEGDDDLDDRPGTPLCDENPETFASIDQPAKGSPQPINVGNFTHGREGSSGYSSSPFKSKPESHPPSKTNTTVPSDPRFSKGVYSNRSAETPKKSESGMDSLSLKSFTIRSSIETSVNVVGVDTTKPVTLASPPPPTSTVAIDSNTSSSPPESSPIVSAESGSLPVEGTTAGSEEKESVKSPLTISVPSPSASAEPGPSGNPSPMEIQESSNSRLSLRLGDEDSGSDTELHLNLSKDTPATPNSVSSPTGSSDSESTPSSHELEQRIQSFYERYDEWSGGRSSNRPPNFHRPHPLPDRESGEGGSKGILGNDNDELSASLSSATARSWFGRSRVFDIDEMRQQPSEIVKSLLAKKSVFDDDTKRLENFSEKYEGKTLPSGAMNWRLTLANRSSSTTSSASTSSSLQTPCTPTTPNTPLSATSSSPNHPNFMLSRHLIPNSSSSSTHQQDSSSIASGSKSLHLNTPPGKRKDLNLPSPLGSPNNPLSSPGSKHQETPKIPGKPLPPKCTNSSLPIPSSGTGTFIKPSTLMSPPDVVPPSKSLESPVSMLDHSQHPHDPRLRGGTHGNPHAQVKSPHQQLQHSQSHPAIGPTISFGTLRQPAASSQPHLGGSGKLQGPPLQHSNSHPLPSTPTTPVQSGIHMGMPRIVERSMSLDSKRSVTGSGPGLQSRTFTASSTTNTISNSSSVPQPSTPSTPHTPTPTICFPPIRRISVDSPQQHSHSHKSSHPPPPPAMAMTNVNNKEAKVAATTKSSPTIVENGPTKRKLSGTPVTPTAAGVVRPGKDFQKPTPSLTIVSGDVRTGTTKEELRADRDRIGQLVKEDASRLRIQHVQEPTVGVVATIHHSGKEKDGHSVKNSSKRDKDPLNSSKKSKKPDNVKSSEPPPSVKPGKEKKSEKSEKPINSGGGAVSGDKEKEKSTTHGENHHNRHHSHSEKKKDKEGKVPRIKESTSEGKVKTESENVITQTVETNTGAPAVTSTSHKTKEEKIAKAKEKRRLSSQEEPHPEKKKVKLEKEKPEKDKNHSEKVESTAVPTATAVESPQIVNPTPTGHHRRHHHHHHRKSGSTGERRESHDSGSSGKDKGEKPSLEIMKPSLEIVKPSAGVETPSRKSSTVETPKKPSSIGGDKNSSSVTEATPVKKSVAQETPVKPQQGEQKLEIISGPVKDKSSEHRSKSNSSSSSKHHHHQKDKSEKEKSNSQTTGGKEKDKTKTVVEGATAKENHLTKDLSVSSSKHSSSSSTHRHGSHHKKDKEKTKENGPLPTNPTNTTSISSSSSKNKDKSKEKSSKEKLISTSSSILTTSVDSDAFEMAEETVPAKPEKQREKKSSSSKRDRHKSGSGGDRERASSPTAGSGNNSKDKTNRTKTKEPKKKRRFNITSESDSPNNDSDDNDDDEQQKHHSIFEVVVDEYVSMYDKVKARSNRACKNVASVKQQKEEQRKQDKLQESFQQLKKSRAKREEKKRSTSIDERKSIMNTTTEDDDSDIERAVAVKRRTFDELKRATMPTSKPIISSDEGPSVQRHSSISSKSKSKVKNHSKRDSLTKKPSSLTFMSNSDEDDSSHEVQQPAEKKRKLGIKHQRHHEKSSLTVVNSRTLKSSEDSLSETENEKVTTVSSGGIHPSVSSLKKSSSSKSSKSKSSHGRSSISGGVGIYTESDSSSKHSHGSKQDVLSQSSSKPPSLSRLSSSSKSKKDKASKQKSIDAMKKSLFDSSDESGTEKSVPVVAKKVDKENEKIRSSKDREGKSKSKKKSSHRTKSSGSVVKSGSSSSKKDRQRRESTASHSAGVKRESASAMEKMLFGDMTSSSNSEGEGSAKVPKVKKSSGDKSKLSSPVIPINAPSVTVMSYPETPLTSKKSKSKSEKSQRRNSTTIKTEEPVNNSIAAKVFANSATPLLKAASLNSSSKSSSSSAEKKKRKLEKLAKRSESHNSALAANWSEKINATKDYGSLFNSPVPSPTAERFSKSPEKSLGESPFNLTSEFSPSKFFSLPPKVSPTLATVGSTLTHVDSLPTLKEKQDMFSSDEDEEDEGLKKGISSAIMASDEQESEEIQKGSSISLMSLEMPHDVIDEAAAAAAAAAKRLLEEEEKKRHCLFEQDKAIASILGGERKSPPRAIHGLNLTPGSSILPIKDDEAEVKDDLPKDDTAISQEETEDAVAALLETLDRDDTGEEETHDKPRSPPTLRIIEESPASTCGEKDGPSAGSSPWYASSAKSPQNDLQIDEGEPEQQPSGQGATIDLRKSSTESLVESGLGSSLAEGNEAEKKPAKRTSSRRGTRSRQGSSEGGNSSADVYEFHDDSDEDRDRGERVRKVSPSPLLHSRLNVTPTPTPATTPPAVIKSESEESALVIATSEGPIPAVETIKTLGPVVSAPAGALTPPAAAPQISPQAVAAPTPVLPAQTTPPIVHTVTEPKTEPEQQPTIQFIHNTMAPATPASMSMPQLPLPGPLTSSPPASYYLHPNLPLKPLSIDCPPPTVLVSSKPQSVLSISPVGSRYQVSTTPPTAAATPVSQYTRTTVDDTIDDVIRNVCGDHTSPSITTAAPTTTFVAIASDPEPFTPSSAKPSPIQRGRSRSKSKDSPDEMSSITATINRVAMSDIPVTTSVAHKQGPVPGSAQAMADILHTALQNPPFGVQKLSLPMIETRTDSHGPGSGFGVPHKEGTPGIKQEQTLIDPTTGVLIPMVRQPDEQYLPAQGGDGDREHRPFHHMQMAQAQQLHQSMQAKIQKNIELERAAMFEQQMKMARPGPEGLAAMFPQQQIFQQQSQLYKGQIQQGKPPTDYQFHGQKQMPPNSSSLSPGQKSAIMYAQSQSPFHPNLGPLQSGTPPPSGQFGSIPSGKATPTSQSPGSIRGPPPPGLYGSQQQMHQQQHYQMPDGRGIRGPMSHQQIVRPGPPPPSSPQLLTAQPCQQLVRIPQIPSATTITKVDTRAEEQQNQRKLSMSMHSNVIVTTTNGPTQPVIHSHQIPPGQPPRAHEPFGQAPPRVEISGNVVPNSIGSPKAGRVPPQHEQSQPQSSQQRIMTSHHNPYDSNPMAEIRLTPQHRILEPPHYMPAQTSHQQVAYPHHYIPVTIGGTGGGNLPPDASRQPSPGFALRPGSVPADAGTGKATHQPELGPNRSQMLERPLTAHMIPPHMVSPHTSVANDRGSTESPHLVPHPIYAPRQPQIFGPPVRLPPPLSLKQRFLDPYAELDQQSQYAPHSVQGYHHVPPGVALSVDRERDRERDVAAEEAYILMQARRAVAAESPPTAHFGLHAHAFNPEIQGIAVGGGGEDLGRGGGGNGGGNNGGPPGRDRERESPAGHPQQDSLLTLLQRYPIMWQGLLALKNDSAACQMHFVSGNMSVASESLPAHPDGSIPPLRISQRMRLEQAQLEGVARKMQLEPEHCILLALPCGRDHTDVLQQSTNLRNGFITYLQLKQAAGIVNIHHPETQAASFVIHIFPACDFANENLARIAPDLLHGVADIAHLLIVIATV